MVVVVAVASSLFAAAAGWTLASDGCSVATMASRARSTATVYLERAIVCVRGGCVDLWMAFVCLPNYLYCSGCVGRAR